MTILGLATNAGKQSMAIVQDGATVLKTFDKLDPALLSPQEIKSIEAIATIPQNDFLAVGKQISTQWNKPLIEVDKAYAQSYTPFVDKQYAHETIAFPLISLIVSRSATTLLHFANTMTEGEVLAQTTTATAGQAFEQIAQELGLPEALGHQIEEHALQGDEKAYEFPRPLIDSDQYEFDFTELLEAVRLHWREEQGAQQKAPYTQSVMQTVNKYAIADVAACFQEAVIDVLTAKVIQAVTEYKAHSVVLAGGVAVNKRLQNRIALALPEGVCQLYVPNTESPTVLAAAVAGQAGSKLV